MATNTEPFARLTGTWDVYIAPHTGTAEAEPAVNASPSGDWVLLGPTDGDQEVVHAGNMTYFFENGRQGPVKGVRDQEEPLIRFSVVGLTLENYAYILDHATVTTAAGPPATKTANLKRGGSVAEYSLLLRGSGMSPYGNFPAQYYIPKCVQGGEPTATYARDGSPALLCEYHILEDPDVAAAAAMGHFKVQTS